MKLTIKDLEYVLLISFSTVFYGGMNLVYIHGVFELPNTHESIALIMFGALLGALASNRIKKLKAHD